MAEHPEVTGNVDQIVFVLNSGDFGLPSSWRSEETHPRSRPLSSLWYLLSKYLFKGEPPETPDSLLVTQRDWRDDFRALAKSIKAPMHVILYPSNGEPDAGLVAGEELASLGATSVSYLSSNPNWTTDLYRDGIHPTPMGTAELARFIASVVY